MNVVIGAGPAGVSAAIHLLELGEECILIDKGIFPRNKVHSGIVTQKTYELISDAPEDMFVYTTNKVEVTKKGSPVLHTRTRYSFRFLNREVFDYWYLQKFINMGGTFMSGMTLVQVIEHEKICIVKTVNDVRKKISYDNLVYACGCAKIADSSERIKRNIAIAAQAHIQNIHFKEDITLDLGYVKDGYCWQFPLGEEIVVGYGALDFNIKKFQDYLSLLKLNRLETETETAPIPFGYSSLLEDNLKKAKNGIYIIGDSAGLADPITGEGMYFALKSGEFAAKAISIKDINPFTANMRNAYNTIEDAQSVRNMVFAFKDIVLKAAKMKINFFTWVCDEVVSMYHIPYKPLEIIKQYKKYKG